jgi:hypothetical protein
MTLRLHPTLLAPSLLLVAAACSPSPAPTETPMPAPTQAPPATAIPTDEATPAAPTETPAPASTPAYLPDAAALRAFDYAGWQTYANAAYGFGLRYPASWTLEETLDPEDTMYQHRVTLGDPSDPKAVLHIAFKAASEDRRISPTGMAGGELLDRGSMLFLGEELPRQALVAEGKDMAVVYVCGQVHFGGPVFWCGLHYAGSPLTDPGLSPETERLADAVIASIQVLP